MDSARITLLATIIVTSQLTACGGGGGGGGGDVTASSNDGAVLDDSSLPDSSGQTGNDSGTPAPAPSVDTGSFSLGWTAPTTRSDGTPLSLADIDGFRIYYGTTEGVYPDSVNVSDGSAESATVNNIPTGTYYVVMTTYDVNGLESGFSPAVVKSVL